MTKKVKSPRIGKCRTCGKEFVISLRRHYCSAECQRKAKALRGTEEARRRSAAKFAALPPKRCIYCGKEFKPDTLFAYRNAKFCSPTCANRHRFYPTLAACEAAKAARQAEQEARRERDSFGLNREQRIAVIRAQAGDRDTLWRASQSWTPAQRKFAAARYREIHQSTSSFTWGKY